jgi:hypothetical protein
VTVAYDPEQLPAGDSASDVVIMTAPVGSAAFAELPTTISDATHVSATTLHFSDFVATARAHGRTDQGTPADMSAAGADMASAADLAGVSTDMAGACSLTFQPNGCLVTGCGNLYSLNCAQTQCYCARLNMGGTLVAKPAPYTGTTTCPPPDVMTTMWTASCMFP